jgi:hypothetical protein
MHAIEKNSTLAADGQPNYVASDPTATSMSRTRIGSQMAAARSRDVQPDLSPSKSAVEEGLISQSLPDTGQLTESGKNPDTDNAQQNSQSEIAQDVYTKTGSVNSPVLPREAGHDKQRVPRSDSDPKLKINRLEIQIVNQPPNPPSQKNSSPQPQEVRPDLREALIRRHILSIW